MTRRFPPPALLLPLALLAPGGARAAPLEATVAGSSLAVDSPCAATVEIRVDPVLRDRVALHAVADYPEELAQLRAETRDGVARLDNRLGRCWRPRADSSFTPTLALVVGVPPGYAVAIDEAGAARYAVGPVGGPLALDLSGAVTLRALLATTLHAALSGTDTVEVAQADGDAHLDLSGDDHLRIDQAAMPTLRLALSGVGTATVAAGQVGRAVLSDSGAGTIRINATVGDAAVAVSGFGSVRLRAVTGRLSRAVDGAGTVSVGP